VPTWNVLERLAMGGHGFFDFVLSMKRSAAMRRALKLA
jgi:hypothetical protein